MEFNDAVAVRTMWGEARGEGQLGEDSVAHVIRNRIATGRWGHTAAAVCLAPMQFSCWNAADANRRPMLEMTDTEPALVALLDVWHQSLTDVDHTQGATHYKVVGTSANWAVGLTPVVTIGHHEFYRGVA